MLVKLIFFISCDLAESSSRHRTRSRRIDQINANTKARLRGVNLHLGMFLVLFTLRLDLVNGLLEEDLELSLRGQLLVVGLTGIFEKSALMLHHFAKFLHDAVVSVQFLLLCLYFAHWHVDKWTALLVRSRSR